VKACGGVVLLMLNKKLMETFVLIENLRYTYSKKLKNIVMPGNLYEKIF